MEKEEKITKEIDKITGTMKQEGFDLTPEIKENVFKCLTEETTVEEECNKIIKKYGKTNG